MSKYLPVYIAILIGYKAHRVKRLRRQDGRLHDWMMNGYGS